MKRTFYIYAYSILIGALCCYSCYDDKGNYTYTEINKITISGLEEEYSLRLGDPITIKPVINFAISDEEADYTYQWVWINASYKEKSYNAYVWSEEKEWDNFPIGLPSGTHSFYYRIKDNKTGVIWFSDTFKIKIVNDISAGFFILSEVEGIGRLDFINYAKDTFDLRLDILTNVVSGVPVLEKPLGVTCMADVNSPYTGASTISGENAYMAAILTENGMYRLHPSTLMYEDKYNMTTSIMVDNMLPSDFYVKKVLTPSSGSSDFVLMDGNNNLYFCYPTYRMYATANTYTNTYNKDKHRMNISPIAVYPNNSYYTIMYDTDSLSFARQTSISSTESQYYDPANEQKHVFEGDTLLFKFNKTGKELIYMHFRARLTGVTGVPIYAILKDPGTSDLFFGCFSNSGVQQFYRQLKNLPDASNIKEFAMTHNTNNRNYANEFLYYRTDTKIYAYNINDNTTIKVFDTDPGELISCFKFIQLGNASLIDQLMICTYNPSLPAESCGKMRVVSTVSAYGTLVQMTHFDEDMIWTGFGKIIDLSWKNK